MQCRYYTDEERVEIRRELLKEMEERKVCVSASVSLCLCLCPSVSVSVCVSVPLSLSLSLSLCLHATPCIWASGGQNRETCIGVWRCGCDADEEEDVVRHGAARQDELEAAVETSSKIRFKKGEVPALCPLFYSGVSTHMYLHACTHAYIHTHNMIHTC